MNRPVRVLVVDDSAFMRKMLRNLIESHGELQVVGTALDGEFALKKLGELNPDVITLDMEMPRMDGIETLRRIREITNVPVIMVSSHTRVGAEVTLRALELGAVDFVAKPAGGGEAVQQLRDDLLGRLLAIGRQFQTEAKLQDVQSRSREVRPQSPSSSADRHSLRGLRRLPPGAGDPVLAIGISTGGPRALAEMLPRLPADLPAAVLVVQHMPESFTGPFAERLDQACSLTVKEAADGDPVRVGQILIARGDHHLVFEQNRYGRLVRLIRSAPVSGHRPSVDVLFHSVARMVGARAIGLQMTGMGHDGVEGLGAIRAAGGFTLAQDEASSTIYGMNRVAIERGFADLVLPLDRLSTAVVDYLGSGVRVDA